MWHLRKNEGRLQQKHDFCLFRPSPMGISWGNRGLFALADSAEFHRFF